MRLILMAVAVSLTLASAAWAQEDDLAPLPAGPAPKKGPPAKAPPKGPAKAPSKGPKAAPAKPPVAADDDLAPLPAPDGNDLAPPLKAPARGTGGTASPPALATGDGTLKVRSPASLTNAMLSVDGKDIGTLPVDPLKLSPGDHSLMVKRLGYAHFLKKVNIGAGRTTEVDVKMQAVNAILSVSADQDDAQVFIDGRLISSVPVTELEMPAKTIELIVRKEGFKDNRQTLELEAGKDYPIKVKLKALKRGGSSAAVAAVEPVDRPVDSSLTPDHSGDDLGLTAQPDNRPLTQRWYFWAGAAAAVTVAAVVGTVVVNNSLPPRPLNETEVCGRTGGCKGACINLECSIRATAGGGAVLSF